MFEHLNYTEREKFLVFRHAHSPRGTLFSNFYTSLSRTNDFFCCNPGNTFERNLQHFLYMFHNLQLFEINTSKHSLAYTHPCTRMKDICVCNFLHTFWQACVHAELKFCIHMRHDYTCLPKCIFFMWNLDRKLDEEKSQLQLHFVARITRISSVFFC